jgi:hypothetical protein
MATQRADRFLVHFAVLFLCVLLTMFALFHLMRANNGRAIGGGVLNFDEAFRVNLFIIDLSLLVVFESLLIFVFIRYTIPALVTSTVLVAVLSTVGRQLIGRDALLVLFARLVRNEYAALGLSDVVFLFLLNALLMAFVVAIMHHHQLIALHQEREAAEPTRWSPRADAPPPAPNETNPDTQAAAQGPDTTGVAPK